MSEISEPVPDADESPKPGLSRRDFLRRAGKEVADTGTKIVPGAALTRRALGLDSKPGDEPSKGLIQRFADWRGGRRKDTPT